VPAKRRKAAAAGLDPARASFEAALQTLRDHPIFGPLLLYARLARHQANLCPAGAWLVVTADGWLHPHPTRRAEPEEWVYAVAHGLLHLGFGHHQQQA
jgi:hypothetical protein